MKLSGMRGAAAVAGLPPGAVGCVSGSWSGRKMAFSTGGWILSSCLRNSMIRTAYLWVSDLESAVRGCLRARNSIPHTQTCRKNEIRNPEGPLRNGGGSPNSTIIVEDLMTEMDCRFAAPELTVKR